MMQNMFSKIFLDYIKTKYFCSAKETAEGRAHPHHARDYSDYSSDDGLGSKHQQAHFTSFYVFECLTCRVCRDVEFTL